MHPSPEPYAPSPVPSTGPAPDSSPSAGPPTGWRPRTPRRGLTVGVVVGIVVALVALIATIAQIAALTGTGAAVVGSIIALVPLGVVLLGIRWIDRWEPEPRYALVFAFLWGAGVSTLVSLWLNTAFTQAVYLSTGNTENSELIGAAIGAPLIEETAKGVGILIVFLARRRYFDGPVDGIVYGAMVAAGFAFVENILYFGTSIDILPQIFVMRGILSPFAHVLFSAAMGIALGLAARSRHRHTWVWALPIGWLLAVVLHSLWNASAYTGTFFGLYVVVQVPVFVATVVLVVWLRSRERRIITVRLAEYAQAGWFAPHEVTMLSSFAGRRAGRAWASRGGRESARAMRTFQRAASDLAFGRQRMVAGRADLATQRDERSLLQLVTASRATFLNATTR